MHEYLPILIVGAIIGTFSLAFVAAYVLLRRHQTPEDEYERQMSDWEIIRRLARYGKPYWKEFILVLVVMLISITYDLASPLLIGHLQNVIKGSFEMSYLYKVVLLYASILVVSMICMTPITLRLITIPPPSPSIYTIMMFT